MVPYAHLHPRNYRLLIIAYLVSLAIGKDLSALDKPSSLPDAISNGAVSGGDVTSSTTQAPECPKFEEGHCQCVKADSDGPAIIIEAGLGNYSGSPRVPPAPPITVQQLPDAKPNGKASTGPQQFNIACSFTKAESIKAALRLVSKLNISQLTLVHNVISVLDDDFFQNLTHVDKLYLKYNRITNISANAFRGALENSLTYLFIDEFYWYSFHFKAFDTIPSQALIKLKKLRELVVSSGYLANITKSMLQGLAGLQKLTLKGYKLARIEDDAFDDLTSLKSLEVKSSNLAAVPTKALGRLSPSLEEFKLESRKIQALNGTAFSKMSRLRKLDLSSCSVYSVADDAFDGLETSLKVLMLDRNSLKSVPRALNSLRSLEILDLGFNDLHNLEPNSFISLSSLKNLSLDMNGLISIPEDSLRGLEYSMEYLSLMQNRLTHFPSKALNNMKKLKGLTLSSNMIIEIPAEAFSYPNKSTGPDADNATPIKLKSLDLSRNRINKISGEALKGSRESLEELNLAINKLTDYPKEFGEFTNLRVLDFSLNTITTVPIESLAGSQETLEYLGLSGNAWKCDCKMAAFRMWLDNWIQGLTLRDRYRMEKMIKEAKCDSPEDMKGIPIEYPTINHLVCGPSNNKTSLPPSYYPFNSVNSNLDLIGGSSDRGRAGRPMNAAGQKIENFNSTRTLALMGFLMSLFLCLGLLGFSLTSCFFRNGRTHKKLFFGLGGSSADIMHPRTGTHEDDDKKAITRHEYSMPMDPLNYNS